MSENKPGTQELQIKTDAMELARLIYDIYREKKKKVHKNNK